MTATRQRLECMCGSNAPPEFCCDCDPTQWSTRPSEIVPAGERTTISKEGCIFSEFRDCGGKLSREHVVSSAVLATIGRSIAVGGALWQASDHTIELPISALTSKILCERHNGALSQLDAAAARFFRCIMVDARKALSVDGGAVHAFAGEDLERWMLKVFVGALAAGLMGPDRKRLPVDEIPAVWKSTIFGVTRWLPGCGLWFVPKVGERLVTERGLRLFLLTAPHGLMGLGFVCGGIELRLVMHPDIMYDARMNGATYRPKAIRFIRSEESLELRFTYAEALTPRRVVVMLTRVDGSGHQVES